MTRITGRMAREMLEVLDELKKELFEEKQEYPFAEWERKRERVRERLRNLPEYVRKAADAIHTETGAGRPKSADLSQRTLLFLFARMMNKSNRDVEELLELFEPLFGFKASYKTVERLYSDEEVKLALHNLFVLLLREEGVSGKFSGDGSGYSLTVTKHYRTNPKKNRSKDYRFVFRMIDLETGMYVGVGYSNRSEMDAFTKAMKMLTVLEISMDEVSLDKYYSSRKVLRMFGQKTAVYVIPKKNISKIGPEWFRIIKRIADGPIKFLRNYFRRNLSEAGFSADKRRFGWTIRQRREDRKEAAMFSIALLHNIFTVRVKPA